MSKIVPTNPVDSEQTPAYRVVVLLVDDQLMIGEAIRRQLASQPDIEFHYCSDPTQAVALAAQVKPTVILQDLVMPGMDGLTLTRQFRQNPATKDTPIIVLSTKEDPSIKGEAFSIGANDYLVKLPDKIELIARIRHHSRSYLNQIQRDEAYLALHQSERLLKESNTTLLSLNQKLEEATRAKSQFLATMSHEIRTPMNAVIGMTSFVLDTEMTDEQRDYIETIRNSGEALLAVINDILDFSKIESGRMELEERPFELRACIEETLELLGTQAAEKNIDLAYLVDDSIPRCFRETARGCARFSSIWSATPSSSPRRAKWSSPWTGTPPPRPARRDRLPCTSPSATPVSASPGRSSAVFLNRSARPNSRPRANMAAPASDSPSARASPY